MVGSAGGEKRRPQFIRTRFDGDSGEGEAVASPAQPPLLHGAEKRPFSPSHVPTGSLPNVRVPVDPPLPLRPTGGWEGARGENLGIFLSEKI